MFILMILMRAWVRVMMRLGKSESAELSVIERSNKMFTINSLCIRRRLPSGPVIDFPPISLSPYHYFSQKHICLDKHFISDTVNCNIVILTNLTQERPNLTLEKTNELRKPSFTVKRFPVKTQRLMVRFLTNVLVTTSCCKCYL